MKQLSFSLIFLLLAACAAQPQQGLPLPGEDPNKTVLPDKNTSSAVMSLLDKAREATLAGDYQRAEVLLERTVRIEPRNASLWNYLAKLRLQQGRYQEAIGLATKSNNLAKENKTLLADNWRIIAHAKYQLGDYPGAEKAQTKAAEIRNEQ